MIWFALASYAIVPIVVFFMMQKKSEEGHIWLVFLVGSILGSLLLFLNSMLHPQSDSPFLWFSTNSMIFSLGLQWDQADWIIQQFAALSLLVLILKKYLDREKNPLPQKELSIYFFCTFLVVLTLSVNRIFWLASLLFCLDVIRLVNRFLESKELISSRRETISLLLRFVSIILLTFLSSLIDAGGIGSAFLAHFFLIAGIVLICLAANYIDQVSKQDSLHGNVPGWFIFLDSVILMRVMSQIPVDSGEMTAIKISLFLISVMLFLGLLLLWFWQKGFFKHGFTIYPLSFLIAGIFFLLGIRDELLFLILPVFFMQLNAQIELKRNRLTLLQIGEMFFLIALPFSPFYLLNKTVLNSQTSFLLIYAAFLIEGLYLVCTAIMQMRESMVSVMKGDQSILLWIVLSGLILIFAKSFFVVGGLSQIAWMAFIPSAGLIFLPVEFLVRKRQKTGAAVLENRVNGITPSQVFEKIMQILLTISNILRQIFEGISAVLEGEGGLLWAVIFLVLLLTLFKGLSQS